MKANYSYYIGASIFEVSGVGEYIKSLTYDGMLCPCCVLLQITLIIVVLS